MLYALATGEPWKELLMRYGRVMVCFGVSVVWLVGGCANQPKTDAQDQSQSEATAAVAPAVPETDSLAVERNAPAGPTSDAAFREPFGFGGTHIFAPLDWPDADRVRRASGAPGPDYWQQQVDYSIDATLLADERAVSARATVTYTNNSPDALDYLWLHLEQNLFKAD